MRRWLSAVFVLVVLFTGCSAANEDGANGQVGDRERGEVSPELASSAYPMRGIEGQLGLSKLNGDTQDVSFTASQGNLFQWHFWGAPEQLQGSLKVVAVNEATGQEAVIAEGMPVKKGTGPSGHEADAQATGKMALPTDELGLWTLDVYIGDKLFGSVGVEQKS